MLKKDNFLIGVLLGIIFPALAWFSVEILKFDLQFLGKKYLLYIAGAILNLILMRFYFKQSKGETAAGIIFSTFISALLFVILNRI